jgi:hypothetical protein
MTDLGSVLGTNHPSRTLSEARGYCWKQFTAFLTVGNLAFIVFVVWGWR